MQDDQMKYSSDSIREEKRNIVGAVEVVGVAGKSKAARLTQTGGRVVFGLHIQRHAVQAVCPGLGHGGA